MKGNTQSKLYKVILQTAENSIVYIEIKLLRIVTTTLIKKDKINGLTPLNFKIYYGS